MRGGGQLRVGLLRVCCDCVQLRVGLLDAAVLAKQAGVGVGPEALHDASGAPRRQVGRQHRSQGTGRHDGSAAPVMHPTQEKNLAIMPACKPPTQPPPHMRHAACPPPSLPLPCCLVSALFCHRDKPVIRKALVDLRGAPMRAFTSQRASWAATDCFRSPGPIQVGSCGGTDGSAWLCCIVIAVRLNVLGYPARAVQGACLGRCCHYHVGAGGEQRSPHPAGPGRGGLATRRQPRQRQLKFQWKASNNLSMACTMSLPLLQQPGWVRSRLRHDRQYPAAPDILSSHGAGAEIPHPAGHAALSSPLYCYHSPATPMALQTFAAQNARNGADSLQYTNCVQLAGCEHEAYGATAACLYAQNRHPCAEIRGQTGSQLTLRCRSSRTQTSLPICSTRDLQLTFSGCVDLCGSRRAAHTLLLRPPNLRRFLPTSKHLHYFLPSFPRRLHSTPPHWP
jgi:hypothetical protein